MEDYTKNNVGVLCHEMFHSLGAPDLYHYPPMKDYPVGEWDVMELTTEPPQSMGAYMKFKYGKWIDEIPTINACGFYEIKPLQSGDNNICYKIPVPETEQEYLLVEYRQKSGVFEGALPSSGLLIYRIWPHVNGNMHPNGTTIFDEVYIYRPGGNYANNWKQSAFSTQNGRSAFHQNITDPACVLTDNSFGSVGIHHVHQTENNTLRFYVAFENDPFLFTKDETVYISSTSNSLKTVAVYSNLSLWEVSTSAEWLSAIKNEMNNEITIKTLTSNNSTDNRTAFVTVSGEDFEQIIKVTQYAGQITLTVTPRTQTVSGEADMSAEYSVSTTYADWNATTTADWVKLKIDLENSVLTATTKSNNPLNIDRQAIIRVTSGTASANVFFVQEVKTVNIKSEKVEDIIIYKGESQIIVIPSKAGNVLRIEKIEIFDIMGCIVQSYTLPIFFSSSLTLDISHLHAGIYFIQLTTDNEIFTKKIIIN